MFCDAHTISGRLNWKSAKSLIEQADNFRNSYPVLEHLKAKLKIIWLKLRNHKINIMIKNDHKNIQGVHGDYGNHKHNTHRLGNEK